VLSACGVAAELTPCASATESESCFQKPVRFDIVAGASKLSGAAQRRTREGMLHQGSILLPNPAMNVTVREKFSAIFARRLGLTFSADDCSGDLMPTESARASALERDRYSTEAWNRMR